MGHELTVEDGGESDVRVHEFYGDWDAVARSLDELPQCGGLALGNGSTADEMTGRFRPAACSKPLLPFQKFEFLTVHAVR